MKNILNKLYGYERLDEQQAYELLSNIANPNVNDAQIASLLAVYRMRQPTIDELSGFRKAMLQLSVTVDLSDYNAIDIVGTGGDGKNTFNISTLSAIVVASTGIKVIKHGSYAASSVCGSSNVLEKLGYTFTSENNQLKEQLEKFNICFLHAPLFHPVMKRVRTIRENIGTRTLFNMLGPIINPAQPNNLLLGVSHTELLRTYNYLLQDIQQQYTIVHSLDGYDEISLTGAFKVLSHKTEHIFYPNEIGFDTVNAHEIEAGDSIDTAAKIFLNVIKGEGTSAQNQVIIVNSGFAIHCIHPDNNLYDCFAIAKESLISKKAYQIFKQITK